ncbi:MAG: SsrA-binding protein [Flavobacteriales bacterium]|nr:SsrA-binding protein [Flavobacteriales bacterium]
MFKILAKINKILLPSMINKDISQLKTYQKIIIAYRYWVTKNCC